jgi:cytochrome c biogenesis protein CcmG/thiol:disulfide interchange protein DsbE
MSTVRVLGVAMIVGIAVVALIAVPSAHDDRQLPLAPPFSVAALHPDQPNVNLSADAGRVMVLLFWASWCVPCRQELPTVTTHLRSASPDVAVVGIDTNDLRDDALGFLRSTGVNLASGFDNQAKVANAFHLYGLPSAAVVTPSGRIAARYLGPVDASKLLAAVARARRA